MTAALWGAAGLVLAALLGVFGALMTGRVPAAAAEGLAKLAGELRAELEAARADEARVRQQRDDCWAREGSNGHP